MKKVLFKHELKDAYEMPISSITIIDNTTNNVIINEKTYSIPIESINYIKEILNDEDLYSNKDVLFPPILDGTSHNIILSSNKKKEIECFNLWYWDEEGAFDDYNKEDIKYTKLIINLINNIQNILNKNKIKFYIITYYDD